MTDATAPRAGLLHSVWANPILLLVLTTLIWAGHSIVGRLAVGQIGPMTLTCMRWAVALVPILIAARPSLRRDWPALRARWLYLTVMGTAGYTVFVALFYVAAHRTSALNLSIIQGAIPALVLLGARMFLGIRFTALQALGAFVTMAGVAVIAAAGRPRPPDGARLQQRRRDDGGRGRALRRLHDRPSPAAAMFRASACSRPWRSPPSSPPCR